MVYSAFLCGGRVMVSQTQNNFGKVNILPLIATLLSIKMSGL